MPPIEPTDLAKARSPSLSRFGLGDLMLSIAVVAAAFAVYTVEIPLPLALFLIFAPALARTLRLLLLRSALDPATEAGPWVQVAVNSMIRSLFPWGMALLGFIGGVAAALFFAIVIMIFAAFLSSGPRSFGSGVLMLHSCVVMGLTGAGIAFVVGGRRYWPIRDEEIGRRTVDGRTS